MKKKIVSFSLVALLVISMIFPSVAYAEDSNANQENNISEEVSTQEVDNTPTTQAQGNTIYVDGERTDYGGIGDDNNSGTTEDKPVYTLKKAVELAGENGTVIVLRTVYIREDTVLDNNVTIKRGGECKVGMIYLGQNSLTINHATIDGNKAEYPNANPLIVIYNAPTLTINEGAKICNQAGYVIDQKSSSASGSGPIITMNGGEICDNDASNTYYDALIYYAQTKGSFYMKGGSIHDNKGGALDIGVPTFEMTGGKIYNNNNAGEEFGGLYFRGGSENSGFISGGEIYNNKSKYGAGINVAGQATFTIKGNAKIHDNTATSSGAGVYVTYGKLIMEGGEIRNNTCSTYGGAIFLWNKEESKTNDNLRARVSISGGLIEGNTDGNAPSGIDFYEDNNLNYPPILELSGSPTIKDPILINDTQDTASKVDIVDTFTPTQPVPIYDWRWEDNRVIVSYKAGLTAKKEDFVKYNKTKTQDIKLDGQNLLSINIQIQSYDVVFKEEDDSATYATIKVDENEKINSAQVPTPTKTGYVLSGWKTAKEEWDFDNRVVTENVVLYPIWKLESPDFILSTDRDHLHEDDEQEATLVAKVDIKGDNTLTYNWKWYKDGKLVKEGKDENVLNVSEAGVYKAEMIVTNGTESSNPLSKEVTITKTNHVYSGDWLHDTNNHWKECDECQKNGQQAAHTFGEWTTVSQSTRERVCTVCGYKVTEEIPETKKYKVTYKFVSGTTGKKLPTAITDLLPTDSTEYDAGTIVTAKMPTKTTVKTSDGQWIFVGYDKSEDVIVGNKTFTGTWTFKENTGVKKYSVSYKFISGTKDKELISAIKKLLPTDSTKYEVGKKVAAKAPAQTVIETSDGQWTFAGYDADEKIISDSTEFIGVWNFTKKGIENTPPVIIAKDITIIINSQFDAKDYVKALDVEDGDLTHKVEILKNTVDVRKEGSYEVIYQVTDSQGATTLSTVTVTVVNSENGKPVVPNGHQPTIKPNKDSKPETGAVDESNSISYKKNTSKKSAKTGDSTPIAFYGIVAGICGLAIIFLFVKRRKD